MNETELLDRAVELINERMPRGWKASVQGGTAADGAATPLFLHFEPRQGMTPGSALVELRPSFKAADVDRLLGGMTRRLRHEVGGRSIVLVSEFLSPRTRELLRREDISYVDLAGNVRLVTDMPPMFVETTGAERRPVAAQNKRSAGLVGPVAGRIARFLAEVDPPYGITAIERATGIGRGYVSRVVDRLVDEGYVSRQRRGEITEVDWPAVLRLRGQSVGLFTHNTVRRYIALGGLASMAVAIADDPANDGLIVTGSFAAELFAPIAAPAQLVAYIPIDPATRFEEYASRYELRAADVGGDVVLMRPSSEFIVEDAFSRHGRQIVNLPQLVVDCLGGGGRLPAEGEAVLAWMQENSSWRHTSAEAYVERVVP